MTFISRCKEDKCVLNLRKEKIQVMVRIILETNQLFLVGTIQMQVLTLFLMEFSKFNWGFEVLLNCFSGWAINACKKQTKSGYLTIDYLNFENLEIVNSIATSRDFSKSGQKGPKSWVSLFKNRGSGRGVSSYIVM